MGTREPISDKHLPGIPQLLEDLQRLSEDKESCDVIFLLGHEEDRVYAHKIILNARCKSFPNSKRGGAPTTIRLPHVNPDVFRQFVLYVYTGKILLHDDHVFEMMTLAQDLGVEELKIACEDYVVSTLSVANSCTFLTAVMEIQEKSTGATAASFMDRIISFIGENAFECVKTHAFLNLSKESLIKIISSDYFCLEEEDVWRSVLNWAKFQAKVSQPTMNWTEDERVKVCQHLATVMEFVRILLIDSQVFAEEVEPTGAVPIASVLERYRYAALHSNKLSGTPFLPLITGVPIAEKRLQPRLLLNLFPGSSILKNDKMHFQSVLNGWYGVPKQTWRLVFRASDNNFSATAFHRSCDGISSVFVIGLGKKGEISGGYSGNAAWSKTNRKGYIHSENAFLFATNCNNNERPVKYDVIKKPYAICYHPEFGPIFGAGADLLFSNGCNTNMDSYSNLPHSYDGTSSGTRSLFGDYNFSILDYEVYTSLVISPSVKSKHERS